MADIIILSNADTKRLASSQAIGTFISALHAQGKDPIATPTAQALEQLSNAIQVLQGVLRKPLNLSGSGSDAWVAYTPSFTGSGGAPIFTVNSFKAAYNQTGKTVTVRVVFNITLTAAPASPIIASLPVAAVNTPGNDQLLGAHCNQFTANPCVGIIDHTDPTHVGIYSTIAGGVFGVGTYSIFLQGTYEAA